MKLREFFWKPIELAKQAKSILAKKEEKISHQLAMDEYEIQSGYPRPQMARDSYYLLDGEWKLGTNTIRVPFAPQAPLSGYQGECTNELVYEKTFSLPHGFVKEHTFLHFGAVDQIAEVYLNGLLLGKHEGGYLPFSFEITHALKGINQLKVVATDTLDTKYPYGKQCKNPEGMWYTEVSGIWQSVWIESVSEQFIRQVTCNYAEPFMEIEINGTAEEYAIEFEDTNPLGVGVLKKGLNRFEIALPEVQGWTPENPKLYHFSLKTIDGKDCVKSYLAFRTITIENVAGHNRLCLNHKPYFFHGVLDQGYFCDGIFTAPSYRYYEKDILSMKALGFNTLRKHIKLEPARFYYDCDRLGMVVFQDMINNGSYRFVHDTALPTFFSRTKADHVKRLNETHQFFVSHSKEMISYLKGFPSVLYYTVFNEGWGQFNSLAVTDELKKVDSTRIYDSASGWFKQKGADILSDHVYFHLVRPVKDSRARVISEFGGFVREVEGHVSFSNASYGYGTVNSEEELTNRICQMYETEIIPLIKAGCSGTIYTQLSDVEEEMNGLYTYDRKVCKVNIDRMKLLSEKLRKEIEEL